MPSLPIRAYRKFYRWITFNRDMPGEILNDKFSRCIERLAKLPEVRTILEIGSAAGAGSTEAFVRAISTNPAGKTLFCMEIVAERFAALNRRYGDKPFLKAYQCSSVPPQTYTTEQEVKDWIAAVSRERRPLERHSLWTNYLKEVAFIREPRPDLPKDGIELIKQENRIDTFDLVLIDGSEYTGRAELERVYGARYILLDDTQVLKNYYNTARLLQDRSYRLLEADPLLRNGYAAFERVG